MTYILIFAGLEYYEFPYVVCLGNNIVYEDLDDCLLEFYNEVRSNLQDEHESYQIKSTSDVNQREIYLNAYYDYNSNTLVLTSVNKKPVDVKYTSFSNMICKATELSYGVTGGKHFNFLALAIRI